jgi:hypothetical protein
VAQHRSAASAGSLERYRVADAADELIWGVHLHIVPTVMAFFYRQAGHAMVESRGSCSAVACKQTVASGKLAGNENGDIFYKSHEP